MADKNQPDEFERIIKRMLATPPKPHKAPKPEKAKGRSNTPKRTTGKGRARVGKSKA